MFTLRSLSVCLSMLVAAAGVSADVVHLDISNGFNYDSIGTANEVSYCNANFSGVHHSLRDILGGHLNGATIAGLVDGETVAGMGYGLETNGVVDGGAFKIGVGLDRPFDAVDGSAAVQNTLLRGTGYEDPLVSGWRVDSTTITLNADQQAKYADINVLFAGERSTSTSARFAAAVYVKYVDDPNAYTLWSDYHSGGAGAGGSFGSAGIDGQGGLFNSNDSDPTWALAHTVNGYYDAVGSPRYSLLYTNAAELHLWKFADSIALDDTKILESMTFELRSNVGSASNKLSVFAASATPVPEPATTAMLICGALAALRRRNR